MQNTKQFRIFIFDPCFGGMTGHWENYCKRLYHELSERTHAVKVFGSKKYTPEIVGEVDFIPLFTNSTANEIKGIFDLNHQAQGFAADFNKIDMALFQDGDIFIFHSIFPQILPAILDWTKQVLKQKKILTTLFFQFPPAESKVYISSLRKKIYYAFKKYWSNQRSNKKMDWLDNNIVRYYQFNSAALSQLVADGHCQLYSSTDILTKNFSLLFGLPVHNLPMPGPKINLQPNVIEKKQSKIKVGYFGHSSLAKGGQFLRFLTESTLARYPSVEFVLHINPNFETEVYLNHFKTLQHSNVHCYFGHLDQEKLQELMEQVDIIILPYSPSKYLTTPSAIFTDAMPFKKVFVLPLNSWACYEAKKHDIGTANFKKFTQSSILAALFEAIDNIEQLKEKSAQGTTSFLNEHNIQTYVDIFERTLGTV